MAGQIQDWELLPVEITGPIRWCDGENKPFLFMAETSKSPSPGQRYQTNFNPIPVSASAASASGALSRLSIPQFLPPAPAWDVAASDDGVVVVAESFGGALTQLLTERDGGDVAPLSTFQGTSYTHPRFVRDGTAAFVSAISEENVLTLFDVAKGDKVEPLPLAPAQDGLIVAQGGKGTSFLLNTPVDKPMSALGANPGTLSVLEIGGPAAQQTRPLSLASERIPLFGGQSVYCFDAVAWDRALVILAMTDTGPALHLYDGSDTPIAWPDGYPPAGCCGVSPTLSAGDEGFFIAFIEYDGSNPTGVRIGTCK